MKRILPVVLLIILFAFPKAARADVAPPIFPPGSNLQPNTSNTQVRMEAETVVIEVLKNTSDSDLGKARVSANFRMTNMGVADEKFPVRFPISGGNGFGQYPEIEDLVIRVNGSQVSYRRVDSTDPSSHGSDAMTPWAEFDAGFPAGQVTEIQVAYTLQATGYSPFAAYYYILETGAGWKDTIGSADIILRMPYEANNKNVVLDYQIGWAVTTPGGVFKDNEVRWHFDNFEPGPDGPVGNMEFAIVSPSIWNTLLIALDDTVRHPKDGEAWGRLGKAYKQVFLLGRGYRTDAGGEELLRLSIDAYEKCLALKPDDAQWHAGFADLLIQHTYWGYWSSGPTSEMYRGFSEINTALTLAPRDEKVLEIANEILWMFPEGMVQAGNGYDFPWLTQTPSPVPPTATITPYYDPQRVAGVYTAAPGILMGDKPVSLTLTMDTGHMLSLETKFEGSDPTISSGTWTDNGDDSITLSIQDSRRGTLRFVLHLIGDDLQFSEYPAIYGDAGLSFSRQVESTPPPPATNTQAPIQQNPTETTTAVPQAVNGPTAAPVSVPSPLFRFCGSAALFPLVLFLLIGLSKRRLTR